MPTKKRVLFIGGGTGGHIIPNLAIASILKAMTVPPELLYVGSRGALDRALVEPVGIPFRAIFTGKLRRYFSWHNIIDPFFVVLGFFQCLWILVRFWPDVIFSKGGFVSLPMAFAAFILRRPFVLHESDAVMGLANRLASRLSRKVCIAFPGVVRQTPKVLLTGNPVRASIAGGDRARGFAFTGLTPEKPVLLVWGGSQGSAEINAMVEREFSELKEVFQIIHVTGAGKKTTLSDPSYRAYDYIGAELADVYAITDLVVGRAGCNSLSELAVVQKPNVLIPLMSAANNHQAMNAASFEVQGASVVLKSGEKLSDILIGLWHNETLRQSMREALGRIARPRAAEEIAELLMTY